MFGLTRVFMAFFIAAASRPLFATDTATLQKQLDSQVKPLLREHCIECHSGKEPEAGLSLEHFDTPKSFLKGRKVWLKAIEKVQLGEMPPRDSQPMDDAKRKFLIQWITSTIEDFECGLTPNPGQVTLRRLNANEYRNTVRDLVGIDYKPAEKFPADDVGYGFDNIGDVLTLPPLLMEKYILAAEDISRQAIMTPPPGKHFEASYKGGQLQVEGAKSNGDNDLTLASTANAIFKEQIPWPGIYQLTVSASGDQAGNEPCKMQVLIDNKPFREIPVPNTRDKPKEYNFALRLKAGSRQIALRFTNDFYVEKKGDRPQQDRNLIIHAVTLVGNQVSKSKVDPEKWTLSHKSIFSVIPKNENDATKATRAIVERLASRAFRRPVEADELNRLTDLAISVQADGDSMEESIQVVLQTLLISPKFLFRVEPPKAGPKVNEYRNLDDFELASRLSYFLWSTMPDDKLLATAWSKKLRSSTRLQDEVKRMMADPKANEFVDNFAGQWLTLRKLDNFKPDPQLFPKWNDEIKTLAYLETMNFFRSAIREDWSVLKLLDADFTYLNEKLAAYYGVPNVKGNKFVKVSLAGTNRAGLLTQASVLAVTSNPTRTSPVKRGKWILDNLLATPPPPAPPGVPELKEKGELIGTLRQRLEQHRVDPACAACHKQMDPLGFALENFDAVGQWRTNDGGQKIDASGELPDGTLVNGVDQLRKTLLTRNKEQFVRCITEKMLTYALGRGLEYYDKCAVDKIVAEMDKNDYKFSTLLLEIVKSDPFQKKGEREIE
jgi:Protein of unknown function (DUF1592)/Protein of unknown function (DUF1588)/Protein of unknown function (DUF1585)/Protein of unknown function (DUF1587)/Protein of unknown function (DUF1595)/Ca-dependent carbohydrate-binding module xylan-binding/Planctomycete cytochrome C